MSRTDSRTADKFVIRMPDGMRNKVDLAAWNLYMSMNSFVIQAIAEKLDRDERQKVLLDILSAAAKQAAPSTTES